MYAILEAGGKQYRVEKGDQLDIERIDVEPGKSYTFDRILLVSDGGKATVGTPTLASASVTADVVDHRRGAKVTTFKMKRRKGYHKTIGHRQALTRVRILDIKV